MSRKTRGTIKAAFMRQKELLGITDEIPKEHKHPKPSRATRKQRIVEAAKKVSQKNNFAICAFSLDIDLNVHLIYRTLACFNGAEFFVVGSKDWFQGATKGLQEHVNIRYFKTPSDFIRYAKREGYNLVSVEQSMRSVSIYDAEYPEKPCFVMGNEMYGLTDDILLSSHSVVEIPMDGPHPCLNVGISAGIVVHDYIAKSRK